MEIVALFALTALLLAGLGIYGVISYIVSERTQEIGIRLALGAQHRNILRMVLREGLALAVTGAVVGLACALIVSHLMAGLLYGIRPTAPLTFAGVALLLIGVAFFACYIPARRAIRVDPLVALRHEWRQQADAAISTGSSMRLLSGPLVSTNMQRRNS